VTHTKGPWRVGSASGIKDRQGQWVGEPTYSVFGNDETDGRGPSSFAHAKLSDANLIAAAPEMLACLELLEHSHAAEDQDKFFTEMHRVLKKARGW